MSELKQNTSKFTQCRLLVTVRCNGSDQSQMLVPVNSQMTIADLKIFVSKLHKGQSTNKRKTKQGRKELVERVEQLECHQILFEGQYEITDEFTVQECLQDFSKITAVCQGNVTYLRKTVQKVDKTNTEIKKENVQPKEEVVEGTKKLTKNQKKRLRRRGKQIEIDYQQDLLMLNAELTKKDKTKPQMVNLSDSDQESSLSYSENKLQVLKECVQSPTKTKPNENSEEPKMVNRLSQSSLKINMSQAIKFYKTKKENSQDSKPESEQIAKSQDKNQSDSSSSSSLGSKKSEHLSQKETQGQGMQQKPQQISSQTPSKIQINVVNKDEDSSSLSSSWLGSTNKVGETKKQDKTEFQKLLDIDVQMNKMQSKKNSIQIHGTPQIDEITESAQIPTPVLPIIPYEDSADSSSSLGDKKVNEKKNRLKINRKDSIQGATYVDNNLF